jgi:hypothetical protein
MVGGEVHTEFRWGNLTERDHLEDQDMGGKIILRGIFRKWGVDRDRWRALVNAVMNLRVP